MSKSRVRWWGVASTFGAIAVVSSLVVSVGGNSLASASQKPDESTTTTTVAPTTTTTAAPTITTTPATVSAVPHDNTWAQLTAQKQKLARSFLSDFRAIRFAQRETFLPVVPSPMTRPTEKWPSRYRGTTRSPSASTPKEPRKQIIRSRLQIGASGSTSQTSIPHRYPNAPLQAIDFHSPRRARTTSSFRMSLQGHASFSSNQNTSTHC